jgi:hypothetical protein
MDSIFLRVLTLLYVLLLQKIQLMGQDCERDIAKVEFSTEHDQTPVDASLGHSFHSMPTSLIKSLIWVTNDNAFNAGA